jgi:hypothetical protein
MKSLRILLGFTDGLTRQYYDKRTKAIQYPDKHMSIIIDGMAQNLTELPYLANQKSMCPCILWEC